MAKNNDYELAGQEKDRLNIRQSIDLVSIILDDIGTEID